MLSHQASGQWQHCCQHTNPRCGSLVRADCISSAARSQCRSTQRIKPCATGSAVQGATADLMSLVPWAIRNGIQFAKIKPAVQPGSGRGLVAMADIQPGECVCNVPVSAALRVYPGCPPVLQIPSTTWQQLPWYGQLALTLLHEQQQGTASKWSDYIKQLPAAVDVPALWSEADVQQLRCSYFISQVQQQQQDWSALQQQVRPYLSAAGLNPHQLHWALSVTRSRTFAAPYFSTPFGGINSWLKQAGGQQQQQQHVLCPLLDMFNHRGDVQSECEYYSDLRSSAFRVVASQPWSRGSQVFINYGSGSNDALLQLYGFVEPHNRDDRYILSCLPAALAELGHRGLEANLSEVVVNRQGLDASAASQLSTTLSGATRNQALAAAEGSVVPYAALNSPVRAVCAAAIQQEQAALAVDAAADREVMQAFAGLPAKQAEMEAKQADLQKATGRLQQLQQLLHEMQSSNTREASGAAATPEQQLQAEQPPPPPVSQAAGGALQGPDGQQQAELEATVQLCQDVCSRLEAELAALGTLLEHWQELTQQHKQLAVAYRVQKADLLADVLGQLE